MLLLTTLAHTPHYSNSQFLPTMTQPNYRATSATTTPLGAREYLTLQNTTATIPLLGFGTYKIRGQTCTTAVLTALSAGYSHIDSAALYRNEVCIYEAIEQSGMSREAIFLTTKVGSPRRNAGQGDVYQDAIETVDRIAGVDGYVDLLLMHVPGPSRDHRQRLWAAMERVKREGRARSIGVSNFRVRHLEELKDYATEWPPSANQIEVSYSLHCSLEGNLTLWCLCDISYTPGASNEMS
jgi:diketogulonate reductase-like aldo/keto reductase